MDYMALYPRKWYFSNLNSVHLSEIMNSKHPSTAIMYKNVPVEGACKEMVDIVGNSKTAH
jgi:hypothetical protein